MVWQITPKGGYEVPQTTPHDPKQVSRFSEICKTETLAEGRTHTMKLILDSALT